MLKCYSNDIESLAAFVSSAANLKKKKKKKKFWLSLHLGIFVQIHVFSLINLSGEGASSFIKNDNKTVPPFLDRVKMLASYPSE